MLATLLLALAPQQGKPAAAPPAPPVAITKPYKLRGRVGDLVLADLAGKQRDLFAENEGKALVLVFWSYRDPVCRSYAKTLAELREQQAGKVAIYLVDSNHDELVSGGGDALAKLREVVEKEEVTLPVLIDRDNVLADDFAATANGQAFLIDANRFLRYHGGIDDDPRGERRAAEQPVRTWLANALDEVHAGVKPTEEWTRPAGRPIKRAPQTASAPGAPGTSGGTGVPK
jgi:hypothetical protein